MFFFMIGEKGCYETPDLSEKLYLSRKGFRRIQNLEPCRRTEQLRQSEFSAEFTKLKC